MALKIKIDPIEKLTVASVIGESTAERRQAAVSFVREGITEADQINQRVFGRVPPRVVIVDGRSGAPLESVDINNGNIVVEYELIADVLIWIGETLIARSPEVTGRFKRGWTLFADGKETPIGGVIPPAEKYVFINREPYARKIEIGKTQSGRAFVIQVPNRIAERTAKDARSRFGNQAKIVFGYESLQSGGAVSDWAKSASGIRWAARRSHRREALRHEWLTRQPAIIVYTNSR